MSQATLHREIISLSTADTWEVAKHEWSLQTIWISEEPDTCLCGHHPIKEICVIKNRTNGKHVEVGNCCVANFLGLQSNKLFAPLKKVRQDNAASFNSATIRMAFENRYITQWEHDWYLKYWRKQNLTAKEYAKKQEINKKLLAKLIRK